MWKMKDSCDTRWKSGIDKFQHSVENTLVILFRLGNRLFARQMRKENVSDTRSTVGRMQLDDYVEIVPDIYGKTDQYRSLWDVWLHALHHAASIAEMARKEDFAELSTEIADFTLWLLTTVHKLEGKAGDRKAHETSQESILRVSTTASALVWKRYPAICPWCYWERTQKATRSCSKEELLRPCDCLSRGVNTRKAKDKTAD